MKIRDRRQHARDVEQYSTTPDGSFVPAQGATDTATGIENQQEEDRKLAE